MNQQNEQVIIKILSRNLIKRDIAINKKKRDMLKDEVSRYRLEDITLDYVLFIIRELTGNKLY
jgi:hypothetical protein